MAVNREIKGLTKRAEKKWRRDWRRSDRRIHHYHHHHSLLCLLCLCLCLCVRSFLGQNLPNSTIPKIF